MAAAPDVQAADAAAAPTPPTFHIGTRRSILARVQADEVMQSLRAAWPGHRFEIHAMSTTGDNNPNVALHKFNDKALWTQELEVLLQNRELDLIVHSLKDVPTQLPVDLELACITAREDARDALIIKPSLVAQCRSLADLPAGSVVGTTSLRRTAQLKKYHPHLRFADVRGSIGTRMAKLDDPDSPFAAIVIAVAGLARVGQTDRISARLSLANGGMLHAVGQGALGIETRKNDARVAELLSRIGCERTTRAALAERSLMRTLEGGCSVPIGVETEWVPKKSSLEPGVGVGVKPADDYHNLTGVATTVGEQNGGGMADDGLTDELVMRAIVISLDGSESAEIDTRRRVASHEDADQFGWDAAKMLVKQGADRILEGIALNRGIIKEQGQA